MKFYERYLELCNEKHIGRTAAAAAAGISKSTASDWSKGYEPSSVSLRKLADYFSVSTDYLLGNTDIKNPPSQQGPEDIAKVALFGGDNEVTDEMWQEVKDYVNYIKQKHNKD
jgi:transcriptional regulator with XRE-family HTH domain